MDRQTHVNNESAPWLSVISYMRNDGYTADNKLRVQRAVNCIVDQLNAAKINSELILIEWNPPSDRPLLLDELGPFHSGGSVSVKGYIVPPKFHQKYLGSSEAGLHTEAANVGLRRARGLFLVPKASDTFFSTELIEVLARGDLDKHAIYRCDRYDVEVDLREYDGLSHDACLKQLERTEGTRHARLAMPKHWPMRDLHTAACGDFTLMSRELWYRVRGYPADPTMLLLDLDSLLLHLAAASGGTEHCLPEPCRVIKPVHKKLHGLRTFQIWKTWQQKLDRYLERKYGHAWAHKSRVLLNYPKRGVRHIPSVVGPSVERNFVWPASRWARGAIPKLTQGKDWGLAKEALEERSLCRASWEREPSSSSRPQPAENV